MVFKLLDNTIQVDNCYFTLRIALTTFIGLHFVFPLLINRPIKQPSIISIIIYYYRYNVTIIFIQLLRTFYFTFYFLIIN